MQKTIFLALSILGLIATTACSKEYRTMARYAKKGTVQQKDTAAMYYIQRKDYDKASMLLEEIVPVARTSSRGEELLFNLAMSKYKMEEYVMSSYYFDQYIKQFPNNKKSEEAAYTQAMAFYRQSDPYFLDQNYTEKAMEALQNFVDTYPKSDYAGSVTNYLTELRERKSRKYFEQAKLYAKTSNHKAAVAALQNYAKDFPDSKYREESAFLLIKSATLLADESVESKRVNRYKDALDFYQKFIDKYPKSVFRSEAEALFNSARKSLAAIDTKVEGK